MDLIDRQAAIDAFDEGLTGVFVEHRAIAEKMIGKIPSADAVEVVRCKYCKWHNGEINQCNAQVCASMRGEDFWSKGERKTDGSDR